MRWVGLGYRRELAQWIGARPPEVGCLEITAEHFFEGGADHLRTLAQDFPLFVHGLGLSLGTPGTLDEETLARFEQVVEWAQPEWISEHIAFTRSSEVDLGHLNPIQPTREMLGVVAEQWAVLAEPLPDGTLVVVNAARSLPDGTEVEPVSLGGPGLRATVQLPWAEGVP